MIVLTESPNDRSFVLVSVLLALFFPLLPVLFFAGNPSTKSRTKKHIRRKTMGKRGGAKKPPNAAFHNPLSLREETSGKLQAKGGSRNLKSFLKLEHLQKLAVWASGEASIPSLGSFYGRQFAATGEALGVQPESSVFPCQRCETILQPGYNCTVRIEKNQAKARHRSRKPRTLTKNNVVFTCHFCMHRNQKRGTPRGYLKEICPPKVQASTKAETSQYVLQTCYSLEKVTSNKDDILKADVIPLPAIGSGETSVKESPASPLPRSGTSLLDAKKRKRNRSGSKKVGDSESKSAINAETTVNSSSKRKRKSWTSLKEIAESNEKNSSQNIRNLTIPLFI